MEFVGVVVVVGLIIGLAALLIAINDHFNRNPMD